jgi:septal ring factor EnvC (AmiA/AmiB activator)
VFRAFLILFLSLNVSICLAADGDSSERLESVQKEIESLETDLSATKADRDKTYASLKQQSEKIAELSQTLNTTRQLIAKQTLTLDALRVEAGVQEQAQQQQLDALYRQIRAAYINAEPSFIELLLNQDDIASLSRTSVYFRYFHEARHQQLATLTASLSAINEEQHELLSAQRELVALVLSQEAQQAKLDQEKAKRQALLADLDKSISNKQGRLETLKQEAENLQKLITELSRQQLAKAEKKPPQKKLNAPFASLKKKLAWPIAGKVVASYGSQRNVGTLKWQGIVIHASSDKDVKASAAGQVVFADWLRGFGLLVIIDHGDQYMTLYGNNESLYKQAGESVEMGEAIAQAGEQGTRGMNGLYFEIRHKGHPTNPLKWLKKQS